MGVPSHWQIWKYMKIIVTVSFIKTFNHLDVKIPLNSILVVVVIVVVVVVVVVVAVVVVVVVVVR